MIELSQRQQGAHVQINLLSNPRVHSALDALRLFCHTGSYDRSPGTLDYGPCPKLRRNSRQSLTGTDRGRPCAKLSPASAGTSSETSSANHT